MSKPACAQLSPEYLSLYDTMTVLPAWRKALDKTVASALLRESRQRYESVQSETSVPWEVIACIHAMESGQNWTRHLHNGDPLTGRTVNVPAGRPLGGRPPFSWATSAIDAIKQKLTPDLLSQVPSKAWLWQAEHCLYFMERYNGWGYRTGAGRATMPPQRSPYLWSGTQHYVSGKYIADGVWSSKAVSKQLGAAPLLQTLRQAA